MTPFSITVIKLIKSIPAGKVATYGQIAMLAGNHRAARRVSRLIHTCARKYQLPWHRVINIQGKISLTGEKYEHQYQLLQREGIEFGINNKIDMKLYAFDFSNMNDRPL